MSASREKKKRQEFLASGAVDPKTARAAEQRAAERKSNILYAAVAAIFVVVAVALVIYNSGVFQRGQTAVTIDGEKYNVAETGYYYSQVYQNYASFYSQLGMDASGLKSQPYGEDGKTYDDFFKESAVDNMKYIHAAVKAAGEAGMTLDGDDEAVVKQNVDSMKSTAAAAGYGYGSYLKAVYGATMTSGIFESCLKDQILASKYASKYSEDNFVYTEDEIQKYYEDNKSSYDVIDSAYVTVPGTPEAKTDDEGNAVEATDEEKAAAMEAARATADEILAAYKAGGDLEQLAKDHDVTYTTATPSSSTVCGQWLFDEGRKPGDADVVEDASVGQYYVAVFNSRQRDEALDYNVRHILVTAANLDLPEGETATEEQLTAKAQEILAGWDGTEEGFAKLAEEYSQDGGSNTNGGLYENVPKGQMVTPFEDWCYEEGRKAGDTGVVYYSGTGAHVMYFVGYGDTQYWHYACENALRSADESEWQTQMTGSVTAEINEGGMKLVG